MNLLLFSLITGFSGDEISKSGKLTRDVKLYSFKIEAVSSKKAQKLQKKKQNSGRLT